MRTNFLQLERSFFDHPKIVLLIEKYGVNGAYCLLFIWSEMMHRDGIFDSANDYDVLAAAKKSVTSVEQVLNIISTCVKINLLTPHPKKKGSFTKDRIDEAIDKLLEISKSKSDAGKASAESKRLKKLGVNKESTGVEQDVNKTQLLTNKLTNKVSTSTEGSRSTTSESITDRVNSAALAPFWVALASKTGLDVKNDEITMELVPILERASKSQYQKLIIADIANYKPEMYSSAKICLTIDSIIDFVETQNEPEELP